MARRRLRKKNDHSQLKIIIIFGIVGLLVLSVGLLFVFKPETINQEDYCPKSGPYGVTALVIDISDPLSASQELALFSSLNAFTETSSRRPDALLEKGAKLQVYFSNETERPDLVFDLCNPGTADQRDVLSKLSENQIFAQSRWNEFSTLVNDEIKRRVIPQQQLHRSTIIETLAYVRASESFPRPDVLGRDDRHYGIVLVSDMLQHSSLYSQYGSSIEDVETIYAKKPVQLNGINVKVMFVPRPKHAEKQNAALKTWWRRYFARAKANLSWIALP